MRTIAGFTSASLVLLCAGCASAPAPPAGAVKAVHVPLAPRKHPVDQLLSNLRAGDAAARASAAWQLAGPRTAEPGVEAALRAAFDDPDEKVREAAAWSLAHLGISPYDEPPTAVRITRPTYPAAAFYGKIEGTVTVDILIGASGKVVHAEVRESIPALDAAALDCAKKFTFRPGRAGGKPVPVSAKAPITFRIGDR